MNKRHLVTGGMVLVVALGLAWLVPASRWAMVGLARKESFYQGRPTSYWSKEIKDWNTYLLASYSPVRSSPGWKDLVPSGPHSRNADMREHPAVLEGDPRAIPVLIELLQAEDAGVREWAASTLGEIGPPARDAIPALSELLKDPALRSWAAEALSNIDSDKTRTAGSR